MIRFKFHDSGVTSLEVFGSLMDLMVGTIFFVSQAYHKIPGKIGKEIFKAAITKAVETGFCWSDNTNIPGEGYGIDVPELMKQMRAAEHDPD